MVHRYLKWAIAALIIILGLTVYCAGPHEKPVTPVMLDSLEKDNKALAAQNEILKAHIAQTTFERDMIRRQRDSVQAISDAATAQIRVRRAALPQPSAVPDSQLRFQYAEALKQLDSAVTELARKDDVIRRDKLDAAKSDLLKFQTDSVLADVRQQLRNEQLTSAQWHSQYLDAWAKQHQRSCGRKCGIAIGVGGTILSALAIRQVQLVLKP